MRRVRILILQVLHPLDVLLRVQLVGLVDPLDLLQFRVHHPEPTAGNHRKEHQDQDEKRAKCQLDDLPHEVDAVDVVDKPHLVSHSVAVGGDHQPIESVRDQVVESRDCPVELRDPAIEAGQLVVEGCVGGQYRGQVSRNGLEQIDPAIPESDQRSPIQLDVIIGVRKSAPDLHVPHREVTKRPDRRTGRRQPFIERDAGHEIGRKACPHCRSSIVDRLSGVGAVCLVPDPDVIGPRRHATALVGVQVYLTDSIVGVVSIADRWIRIDVDPQLVIIDGADPPRDLPGGNGQIDVIGADSVGVVIVGLDVREEVSDGLHLVGYGELLHGVSIAKDADVQTREHVLTVGLVQLVVGDLDRQHVVEVLAEVVGNRPDRKSVVHHHDHPDVGEAIDSPAQVHHVPAIVQVKEMSRGHSQKHHQATRQSQPKDSLEDSDRTSKLSLKVLLGKFIVLRDYHPQLVIVHQQGILTSLRVAENGAERGLEKGSRLRYRIGLVRQLHKTDLTILVVLRPVSMSVTIVFAVPLGPSPCLMNSESMSGVACPALAAVAVVSGLGVIIWEVLQVLQISMLAVCMEFMLLRSQASPGKQICICVTAALNKLVILPILSLKLVKPPQVPSPLIAVSNVKYILQLVISKLSFISGTKLYAIILIIKIPIAHTTRVTVQTLISFFEQGLLSISLLKHSEGGHDRSKRQQSTVKMQKTKQATPNIMQGAISSCSQVLRSVQSPEVTMDSTLSCVAWDWKPAQINVPMLATAESEVVLKAAISNCAGQLSIVMSVQVVAWESARRARMRSHLQFIYFIISIFICFDYQDLWHLIYRQLSGRNGGRNLSGREDTQGHHHAQGHLQVHPHQGRPGMEGPEGGAVLCEGG